MPDGSLNILFGQRVRLLRERSGKTQAQLAERIGVTEQYIGMIERGRSSPSFAVIQKLCQALAVTPALLFLQQPERALSDPPRSPVADPGAPAPSPDVGYWEKNLVTGQVFLSRAVHRMFGLLPEDAQNWDMEKFLDRVHPEDRDTVRQYEPRLLVENRPISFRFRYFSDSDGGAPETRTAQCWVKLETDGQGRPLAACGSVCDVSGPPGTPPGDKTSG